jgi:hypothetical protein
MDNVAQLARINFLWLAVLLCRIHFIRLPDLNTGAIGRRDTLKHSSFVSVNP